MTNPIQTTATGGLTDNTARKIIRVCGLIILFLALTLAGFFVLRQGHSPQLPPDGRATTLQQGFFTLGGAALLAGLTTSVVALATGKEQRQNPSVWTCPLLAGGLGLALMVLGYAFIGVWPLGEKSIMMVDMHHQYAPLLSELRHMLLNGGDVGYNFHIGMGASFIPTFAYYLASPLNLLLVLFKESHLTEGILLITLLKIAGSAAGFTALAQYLYRRRDSRMVLVGVLYALTGYALAYSWNIMWLDVVALLPLVVLAMEHMLRTGKMTPYALLLGLALFCNYYIGFMLCVFLVLYMLVWMARKERTPKELGVGFLRFAGGSLWGAGMVAALLIPTALALGRTSAAGGELGEFSTNFPLLDLLGRMFYGATPTIRSGNLPNLYCGIPAVLLLPVYLTQKTIPLRRRLCYGGLLAVMLFSCTLTQVDLLWHGLHAPNDLPYRFSFIFCFVLLLMAGHALTQLEQVKPKQILGSLLGCCGYLFLWEKLAELTVDANSGVGEKMATTEYLLYLNVALLVVYGVILLLGALKKAPSRVVSRLVLTVVCAELLVGTSSTLVQMNNNEYFTRHEDYIDNVKHEVIDAALRRAEELAAEEAEEKGVFLRMEYLERTTCVDTALHHYSGLTTFASSNPYCTTKFMGELGYAINGVNSYLYHDYVAPVDSLLGLRYVILEETVGDHPYLEFVETVSTENLSTGEVESRHIYRNRLALSLGLAVSDGVKEYAGTKYAPFTSQQALFESMTGVYEAIYVPVTLTTDTEGATIGDSRFYLPDGSAVFTATPDQEAQYYAYVDCRAAEDIDVEVYNQDGELSSSDNVTTYEPYILNLGVLSETDTVNVTVSGEGSFSGNVYLVRLDQEALAAHMEVLEQGQWHIEKQSGSTLTGTVTAKEEQVMFFSIPYDKGWQVLVDGKAVETFPIADDAEEIYEDDGTSHVEGGDDGALLGAVIPAGEHTVTITYKAPGLALGVMTSIASLLLLVIPLVRWLIRRRRNRMVPLAAVVSPTDQPESEPLPESESPAPESEILPVSEPLPERESETQSADAVLPIPETVEKEED